MHGVSAGKSSNEEKMEVQLALRVMVTVSNHSFAELR
jgi:hypothetical protein